MTAPFDPPITSPVSIRDMARSAAAIHAIPLADILGKSRRAALCRIRYAIWATAHDRGFTLTQIGTVFDRHHSSILNGIRNHRRRKGCPNGPS